MKRILALLLVITLVMTLAACGGNLSAPKNGTYKSDGLLSQSWTFSGKDEITLSAAGGLIGTSGTYTISGTTLKVTASMFGSESTTSYKITEITSKSFFIDGTKFIKQ
jgi:hypothetical protein